MPELRIHERTPAKQEEFRTYRKLAEKLENTPVCERKPILEKMEKFRKQFAVGNDNESIEDFLRQIIAFESTYPRPNQQELQKQA